MANNNGKKLIADPQFETSPVRCGRCKHTFEHFRFEVIDDLVQLRCGNVLLLRTEMTCLNCGSVFSWTVRERDIEKMAIHYKDLLRLIGGAYAPE
jgi:DNA-directed RNA polymerase subunit RPC12/RpoP